MEINVILPKGDLFMLWMIMRLFRKAMNSKGRQSKSRGGKLWKAVGDVC